MKPLDLEDEGVMVCESKSLDTQEEETVDSSSKVMALNVNHNINFDLIDGEEIMDMCYLHDKQSIAFTNYRVVFRQGNSMHSIPLGSIDEVSKPFGDNVVMVPCKEGKNFPLKFEQFADAATWSAKLATASLQTGILEKAFAFKFHGSTKENNPELHSILTSNQLSGLQYYEDDERRADELFQMEVKRQKYDLEGVWRITNINSEYGTCPSYPRKVITPSSISNDILMVAAQHRMSRRFPAVVYRHQSNGAVIVRCSQPTVGLLLWRSKQDEDYFKSVAEAVAYDKPKLKEPVKAPSYGHSLSKEESENVPSHPLEVREDDTLSNGAESCSDELNGGSKPESVEGDQADPTSDIQNLYEMPEKSRQDDIRRPLFVDARSFSSAMANRARGGGFEYQDYYDMYAILFMNLDNIHNVRTCHQSLARLMREIPDSESYLSTLEKSRWLIYMSLLLKASSQVCHAIAVEGRPVVVHCSDGWDRTPQITALSQIMLDPYYRTLQGFEVLVEREWCEFGHKFTDRCGSGAGPASTERCPVFLQWLDAVHQLLCQFPKAFQFNVAYLVKLSQHIYSNLFGTFLFNTSAERARNKMLQKSYPVWSIFNFNSHKYINYFYSPTEKVLHPSCHIKDLKLWDAVYRSPAINISDEVKNDLSNMPPSLDLHIDTDQLDELGPSDLTKTRSYDDLTQLCQPSLVRHASESNLNFAMLSSAIGETVENGGEQIEMKSMDDLPLSSKEATDNSSESLNELANGMESSLSIHPATLLKQDSLKSIMCKCVPSSLACVCPDSMPTEQTGIPEASKNSSEVNSEILKGQIEKAEEADENCLGDNFAADHFGGSESNRMLKSDSDLRAAFLANAALVNQGRGSTDTLVQEDACRQCMYSQVGRCHAVSSQNCSVCIESSRVLTEVATESKKSITPPIDANQVLISTIMSGKQKNSSTPSIGGSSNQSICSGSRAHSGKSTPGHSRTSSQGPPLDEESRFSRSNSSCNSGSSSALKDSVDGVTEYSDEVQSMVHSLLSRQQGEICSLRESLALTQRALQRQLQHTNHHCGRTGQQYDNHLVQTAESVVSMSPASNGVLDHTGHLSDASWEALDITGESPTQSTTPGVTIMGRAPSTLWVPDHMADNCHSCHSQFWIGKRKHHCRNCGGVFCNICSNQSVTLPKDQLYQPVRVCRSCYHALGNFPRENSVSGSPCGQSLQQEQSSNSIMSSKVN